MAIRLLIVVWTESKGQVVPVIYLLFYFVLATATALLSNNIFILF